MQSPTIVIVLAILTLIILIAGVVIMAKGGKVNEKLSNKLMIARVIMQGLALLAVVLFWVFL